MNNKKASALTLSVLLSAAFLCGCGGENKAPNSNESLTSSTSTENGTASDTSLSGTASFLIGLDKEPLPLGDISSVETKDGQITAGELTADNYDTVIADCVYYALPTYPCVTDRESEYDKENHVFKDIPQKTATDYVKAKKGDKLFGFTVREASTEFTSYSPLVGKLFRTSLALDGEITLTGYARMVADVEYGVGDGDILFVPVGNVEMPVVRLDEFEGTDQSNLVGARAIGTLWSGPDLVFSNEFGSSEFKLGNKADTTEDFSALPTDGSSVKVELTLSDIKMSASLRATPVVTAKFKNMTAV